VYPRFINTVNQRPVMEKLLPIEPPPAEKHRNIEYIYEPSSSYVLAQLLPRFVEREVYHAVVEAIASEQSARMVAMRNATENAHEFIQDLTLTYNKARQEMITRDILEVAGAAAVAE
jgi:F-type H+-transporting ATPase subunit gamma